MKCSGCGKDVPFSGKVCPFCQRDKDKDQTYFVMGMILGFPLIAIGYWLFGFWGFIAGAATGGMISYSIVRPDNTAPPSVQIVSQAQAAPRLVEVNTDSSKSASTIQDRIVELNKLRDNGLITDEEHKMKKEEIISQL